MAYIYKSPAQANRDAINTKLAAQGKNPVNSTETIDGVTYYVVTGTSKPT
jgi:hypothetical protein